MISKEEVKHIADLARLELSEKEIEKMQKDLTSILDYFNLLKKAPLPRQSFAAQSDGGKSLGLRSDELMQKDNSVAEKIISAAPDKKDDYIKVKTIL